MNTIEVGWRQAAAELLQESRNHQGPPPASWVDAIRSYLKADELAPEDIGTTDAELDRLWKGGMLRFARFRLNRLRDHPQEGWLAGLIRGDILIGGFTPEDIGTTEAELLRLHAAWRS